MIFADPACRETDDLISHEALRHKRLDEGVVIAASFSPPRGHPRLGGALLRTQPDSRLARLAGEGSDFAFEEIVRRYRSGLVAFAASISSRDSADDVVQDSMVKAHAALLRGDDPDSVKAWLFRIVRNTALNDRRDRKPHQPLDEGMDGVEQPPEALDRRRRLRDLVRAIGDLPRAQREAIVQRELEGKGHEEIARELEISPGAVRQLIFRARAALRAGAGVLVPMQLLRAALLSGATEQTGAGAAATAGMAAKLGIGAALATGALFAGTNAVKDGATDAARQPAPAEASTAPSHGAERLAVASSSTASVPDRRQRVVVTPKRVSSVRTAAPTSHLPARYPQRSSPANHAQNGSQPPPVGTGGSTGGAGGAEPSGGGSGPSGATDPSARDCQPDVGRDPSQGAVSPG